ncbi:MAG: SBBP repeat-containing protein, partial [Gammaproteobacteria bacterium]|nr:SBBP repeat-containing protein [Gammaproteobacteria bacterium]
MLSYSKLLGGDLFDSGSKIAVDDAGNTYLLSRSFSPSNTETNGIDMDCSQDCQSNVVVSKFSGDGSSLIWTVVLSGSGDEDGRSILVDQEGHAYIAGWTNSEDFPLIHAVDKSFDGLSEGFLTKIAADGTDLVFSSYVGNEDSEIITDLALDQDKNIYVAGRSSAPDYSETANNIGRQQISTNGFVRKFRADGKKQLYFRKLGGSDYDSIDAITVNRAGEVFAAGTTNSWDFPLESPLYGTIGGVGDAFVSRLSADGKTLLFSTYFGGQRAESAKAIALDSSGDLIIAGTTTSDDLPVMQAFDEKANGGPQDWDCFVSKINHDGSRLLYSSYLGGSKNDYLTSLYVDRDDAIYLGGYTLSDDFPLENPISAIIKGRSDLFISKLPADGSKLLYSTYFGGSGEESFADITADRAGSTYLTGLTYSDDLPVANTANLRTDVNQSAGDVFVSKLTNLINYTVPNNQWQVISLPYMPPDGATVEDIFADDFGYAYKKNWYIYQYNSETDLYSLLDFSDPLEQGTAYWILQNTGKPVSVDMPEGSYASAQQDPASCPDGKSCYTLPLKPAIAENRYHFLGNP